MRKVKEIITKTYRYNGNGDCDVLTEEVDQYHYLDEDEKLRHKNQMESEGFEDSGQVKTNINQSIMNPEYVWFGNYYRVGWTNNPMENKKL